MEGNEDWLTAREGQQCIDFIRNLTLVGEFSGQPVVLIPEYERYLRQLFGTIDPKTGIRVFKNSFLFIPRSNGKTLLAVWILLYCLLGTGKRGQEIYSAASSKEQAAKLFDYAAEIIENDPYLARITKVYYQTKTIEYPDRHNVYKALCAQERSGHSHKPSVILYDELHLASDDLLWRTLKKGMATRPERLVIAMSTAGSSRHGLCFQEYTYAKQVRDERAKGNEIDPTYLPMLYTPEDYPDLSWGDEELWRAVNPAYDYFFDTSTFREDVAKAKINISEELAFKQLTLNYFIARANDVPWCRPEDWDACGKRQVDPFDLKKARCWGGLDLSAVFDISAFVLLFELGEYVAIKPYFWIPEEYAQERARRDRVNYLQWASQGHITLTPGNVIDYGYIRQCINELATQYRIQKIIVDPQFNAYQICTQLLNEDGLPIEFLRPVMTTLTPPTKELQRLVASHSLIHPNHPTLNWMSENAVLRTDGQANAMIDRERSRDKVDGLAAIVNAVFGWMQREEELPGSNRIIWF